MHRRGSLYLELLDERVLVFDGAMGTNIQACDLPSEAYGGKDGCNEYLAVVRPAVIEEIHRLSGVAGVGKEIRLRDVASGEEQTLWLLGEGDSQYGHEVVSYKAPLGQALVGKHAGDTVRVGDDGPTYEILAITERLP